MITKKGRNYTIHIIRANNDGKIPEIEKEISGWTGLDLEITIKRLH